MQGFSHSDRIGGDMSLLEPERIQSTICKGKDIFGMLPEAFRVCFRVPTTYGIADIQTL